jgi:hypothetical protein
MPHCHKNRTRVNCRMATALPPNQAGITDSKGSSHRVANEACDQSGTQSGVEKVASITGARYM